MIDCYPSFNRQFFDWLRAASWLLLTVPLFADYTCYFPFDFARKGHIGGVTGAG